MSQRGPAGTASGTTGRSARDHALRVLFTLSLAWALLEIGMVLFGERMGAWNLAQEGSRLHTAVEDWAPPLFAVAVASLLAALLVRLVPRFLSVPRRVTSLRLWVSLLVTAAIVGVALLVVPIAVTVILDPPGPRPDDVQYIPLAFWLAPWAAMALTPVASILIAWGWTARQRKVDDDPIRRERR